MFQSLGVRWKPQVLCSLFTGLLFLGCPFAVMADPADDIQLDGVMYSASEPEKSVAVINGDAVMPGSQIGNYKVKEIRQSSVVLTDAAGAEKILGLKAVKSKEAMHPALRAASEAKKKEVSQDAQTTENPLQAILNPGKLLEQFKSAQVLMDLRNLRMQIAMYYGEHGSLPPIDELVEKGEVNPAFKGGIKGGYRFRFSEGKKGPMIFADPVEETSNSDHYMIDDWGNLRKESGKPATYDSPLYNS